MFYTLVSRTVVTKINTSRDYFNIFLIGSVGYVILHWYLHMEKRDGIIEKVREYLYYTMVVDVITAYAMMIMYPVKKSDEHNTDDVEESKENDKKKEEEQYTPDQKKAIMQKMQEARRLQQMRHKDMIEQKETKETKETKESNVINVDQPKKEEDNVGEKKSIFTKSEESKESNVSSSKEVNETKKSSSVRIKGKKKESEIEDTEIPVFEDKKKDNK